jgi:hypothetical protein
MTERRAPTDPDRAQRQRLLAHLGGATFWFLVFDVVTAPFGAVAAATMFLFAPALIGVGLGMYAGRNLWAEGALAGAAASWLHLVIGVVFLTAVLGEPLHDTGPGSWGDPLTLAFLLFWAGAWTAGVVAVGAYLGSSGSYLRASETPSPFWANVGWLALAAPILLLAFGSVAPLLDPTPTPTARGGATPVTARVDAGPGSATGTGVSKATRTAPTLVYDPAHALRRDLADVMEAQVFWRLEVGAYAADPDALLTRAGHRLEISWADTDGWAGRLTDVDRPRLYCDVLMGEVPDRGLPAGSRAAESPERIVCSTDPGPDETAP